MALSKSDLFAATRKTLDVETDIGTIRIVQLSASEAIKYGNLINSGKTDQASAYFLSRSLVDEESERLVTREEADKLVESLPATVMEQLITEATTINSLNKDDAAAVRQNFTPAANGVSPTA